MIDEFIAYIRQCPSIGTAKFVNVDRYDEQTGYSVSPSGSTVVRQYKDGSALVESDVVLYMTENADDYEQRLENSQFVDDVFAWVMQQSANRKYPDLGRGTRCIRLEAANGMLYDVPSDGRAVYQIQFKLTYFKGVE